MGWEPGAEELGEFRSAGGVVDGLVPSLTVEGADASLTNTMSPANEARPTIPTQRANADSRMTRPLAAPMPSNNRELRRRRRDACRSRPPVRLLALQ